ncbi:unnamed protein product [Clonostachys byssicola]|uniref:DUF7730 domain-containing protein n=1 Tax=Clonostachys byssicola TaxID=160290 RepID=A0A9N9U542_9HYPO|nr:unnamed protein product [Clonostachys byssicola]
MRALLSRLLRLQTPDARPADESRPREEFRRYIPELAEPVPALPAERPRVLTPSASLEDLRDSAADATAQSSFFQKLPFEIRRRILVEAFGGHTIHMDLSFDHPERPLDKAFFDGSIKHLSNHGNYNRETGLESRQETSRYKVDSSLPKRWIWRSSDCHRNPPWDRRSDEHNKYKDRAVNASEDRCRLGGVEGHFCQLWPGERPHKCFVGAMGWLLSCRQAYCEGVDVLYGTNTIHTASKQMLLHLDKLLLPQRLSTIRSVELVWHFKPYALDTVEVGPLDDLRTFYTLLKAVPTTFPNLTSFYMALWGCLTPLKEHNGRQVYMDEAESIKITDRDIMTPIDRMISKFSPRLRQCTIALGSLEYEIRRRQAVEAGDVEVEQIHLQHLQERHWRSLKNSSDGLKGYWIQLGHREMGIMYMCSMGEPPQKGPPEDEVLLQPWYLVAEPRHLRF